MEGGHVFAFMALQNFTVPLFFDAGVRPWRRVRLMEPESGAVVLETVLPEAVIRVEAGSEWTTETG